MGRSKISALIGAALFFLPTAGAFAADIPEIPQPAHFGGNWYLRGDIGLAAQHVGNLDNALFATALPPFVWLDTGNFDAAPTFAVGLGWRHSEHMRFDLTAQYRGKAAFSALDAYGAGAPPASGSNEYTAKKSEFTFLANGYWDFSPIHGVTPYVGAGIGASYNIISDFRDVNTPNAAVAYGATAGTLSLAWALHAGLSMQVTNNLTVDLGYSYLDLGNAKSGDLITSTGINLIDNPMIFNHITSHDLKLGVRWAFDGPSNSYYPPVVKY